METTENFDFETMKPLDLNRESLKPGSKATPLSTLIWATVSKDIATAATQITDDIEWGMPSYGKVIKGKDKVLQWLTAGSAEHKEPIVKTNAIAKDWGVFEYLNVGTVSEEFIKFGNEQKIPWPKDPNSLLGQKYTVPQCFVYHINPEGKIDFMRQYLAGNVWAQFK